MTNHTQSAQTGLASKPDQADIALVTRFIDDVINNDKLETLDETLAPGYVYHAPGLEVRGAEGMGRWKTSLPGKIGS